MKVSRKNMRRVAKEQSQICREDYMLRVSQYAYDMLVFFDESAANEHTMLRKRGWSLFGIKPSVKRPLKRSERWSILPAYTINGIMAYYIHQGAINSARFEWFLSNEVLPRCSRFPGPNSILVMDNCSTHHSPGVSELCDQFGVLLIYLPPYSPDFNPIEELFSVIKAWLKRHQGLAEHMSFEQFLEEALKCCGQGQHSKGHFRHADYGVDNEVDEVQQEHFMEEDSDNGNFSGD